MRVKIPTIHGNHTGLNAMIILEDGSTYRGQILCMTYPLIGNYGVPSKSIKDVYGLPKYFESDNIQVSGLVVHELSNVANHRECHKTLDQWLYDEKIPGISGIDTRDLTK